MKNNKKQQVVGLGKLYNDKDWEQFNGKPVVPIGAETETHNLVATLWSGDNFLIGGKTGSGKSAFFHTTIINLLKNTNSKELKLILIDPKQVELLRYKNLPHLLFPVVTNIKDAKKAMEWCMREIERRSDLFSGELCVSIEEYNTKSRNQIPRILIIIDECSDLLAGDHEFFEKAIKRIVTRAQLKGLNIFLGTSRPSSDDVYTKELTSMFDYRIAFATATAEDSMNILGFEGAEKLQGNGEMLFLYPEIEVPTHVQGFYVGEEEIKKAIDDVEKQTNEFKPQSLLFKLLCRFFPGFVAFLSAIIRKIGEKKDKGENTRYHF